MKDDIIESYYDGESFEEYIYDNFISEKINQTEVVSEEVKGESEHPNDKRASCKSHGKDFGWK